MLPKKTISLAGVLVISVALCGTLAAGPETEAAAEPDELKFKWLTQFFWAQDTELNQKIFDMAEDYMGMTLNIEWELPDEFDGPTYFAVGRLRRHRRPLGCECGEPTGRGRIVGEPAGT